MTGDFPYTDAQVEAFHDAMFGHPTALTVYSSTEYLKRLHAAGITVSFPEPRFYVKREPINPGALCAGWFVRDRRNGGLNVAWFYGSNAHRDACEHRDRLNGEAA